MPLFRTARILRQATKPAIRTLTTMPTPTSIPLATLGANPAVATAIQALLLPEYDRALPSSFLFLLLGLYPPPN